LIPALSSFTRHFASEKVEKDPEAKPVKAPAKLKQKKPDKNKKKDKKKKESKPKTVRPKIVVNIPGPQPLQKAYTRGGKVLWHPKETSEKNMQILKKWFQKPLSRYHLACCSVETGLTVKQIKNWFQWFRWADLDVPQNLLRKYFPTKAVEPEKLPLLSQIKAKEEEQAASSDDEKKTKLKEYLEEKRKQKELLKAEKAKTEGTSPSPSTQVPSVHP